MNVTTATELMRKSTGWSHEAFSKAVARVAAGAEGLLLLPYLEGERTPNVPAGTGVLLGLNHGTYTPEHLARAAMEGVTMGMNYGLRRLAELGVKPSQIRVTGGGAKSKVWRQIMADVFNAEVVTLKVGEGAAYGAALQALWCWRRQAGERISIKEITDKFIEVNAKETAQPKSANVEVYRELQALQDEMSKSLRGVFAKRREFVLKGR
jgi:sugar (pentulose or hexulose) kinase